MKCAQHEVAEAGGCSQCELDEGVAQQRSDANFLLKLAAMISKLSEDKPDDEAEMLDMVVLRLHSIATELQEAANDEESHPIMPPLAHEVSV